MKGEPQPTEPGAGKERDCPLGVQARQRGWKGREACPLEMAAEPPALQHPDLPGTAERRGSGQQGQHTPPRADTHFPRPSLRRRQ